MPLSWPAFTWTFKYVPTYTFLNTEIRDRFNLLKTSIADDGRISGEVKNYSENSSGISIASNVLTVDLATANHFRFTLNANITTMTLSNIAASGKLHTFQLEVTYNGTPFTWAWLTSTVKWPQGVAPTMTNTNTKVDRFVFETRDGGTNWVGAVLGQGYAA